MRFLVSLILFSTLILGTACTMAPVSEEPPILPAASTTAATFSSAFTPTPSLNPPSPASPTKAPTVSGGDSFVSESDIAGPWLSTDGMLLFKFLPDHQVQIMITIPQQEEVASGQWSLDDEGSLLIMLGDEMRYSATLHEGVMELIGMLPDSVMILRKINEQGTPIPLKITQSDLPAPLFDPQQVSAIVIDDNWSGYSPIAPITAHYQLRRNDDGFDGKADFAAGGYFTTTKTMTATVHVPADSANRFLETLSEVPVNKGVYYPNITHTDDYPAITITLELQNEHVIFYTESQGAAHIPWKVTVAGKSYVTYSDNIANALNTLDPYLARSVQKELIDSVRKK